MVNLIQLTERGQIGDGCEHTKAVVGKQNVKQTFKFPPTPFSLLLEEVLTEISIHPSIHPSHPLIAFEHLSLYIQKHLGQSVAVCGSLWKGRSWQTKTEPGTARYSRAQSGKARYSQYYEILIQMTYIDRAFQRKPQMIHFMWRNCL